MKRLDDFLKKSFRLLLKLMFVKVKVEGIEKLDINKSYVFMPNHVSFFDPVLIDSCIPHFVRALEVEKHFHWPIYGSFSRRMGNIPIDNKNVRESLKSIRKAEDCLNQGTSIVIFPEAARTVDGEVQPFKRLPFLLAQETGKAIVPVGMSGLFTLMPKKSLLLKPTTLKLKIGDIIDEETVKTTDSKILLEITRNEVLRLFEYK
jgi:1-acyl-sn-glycerol-3-phosphate acyltransferase